MVDNSSGEMTSDKYGNTRPIPDPTVLTTEQLMREISRIEAIISLQVRAVDERLTAETNLTTARFVAESLERASVKQLISEKVEFAAARSDSIKNFMEARFLGVAEEHAALREMLNERYQTQTKALDAAFVAQQAAVATSFDASEKAMAAALLAAKEAVEKANVATEKRFDNVDKLMTQQNTTIIGLLPRAEAEARMSALDARLTDIKSTVDKGFTGSDTRQAMGAQYWGYAIGAIGLLAVVVSIILEVIRP